MDEHFKEFVAAVRNEPCIWFPDDPNFCNHAHKVHIWTQIGRMFSLTVPQAKQRFKSIRDKYRKRIKAGGKPTLEVDIEFLKELKFLQNAGRRFKNRDRIGENFNVDEILGDASDDNKFEYTFDSEFVNSYDQPYENSVDTSGYSETGIKEEAMDPDDDDDDIIEVPPPTLQRPQPPPPVNNDTHNWVSNALGLLKSQRPNDSLLKRELTKSNTIPRRNVEETRQNDNNDFKQITLGTFIDQMIEQEPEETRELFTIDIMDAMVKIKRQYVAERTKKRSNRYDSSISDIDKM